MHSCNLGGVTEGSFPRNLDKLEYQLREANSIHIIYKSALETAAFAHGVYQSLRELVRPREGWLVPYTYNHPEIEGLYERARNALQDKKEPIFTWQERGKVLQVGLHCIAALQGIYAQVDQCARSTLIVAEAPRRKRTDKHRVKHA
jgi:hypothetical protein